MANAGDAHISGVQFELDYAPNYNWMLGMNAEFMEAETDTNQDLNGDVNDNLIAGLRLPLVPKFKTSAWIEYRWDTGLFGASSGFRQDPVVL